MSDHIKSLDSSNAVQGAIHGVPKQFTWREFDQKFYYVDIRTFEVWSYDPNTGEKKSYKLPDNEFVTAIAVNEDGSLIVARQSGIHFFRPENQPDQQWLNICPYKLDDGMRWNNGAAIKCADGQTRFFVGNCPINGKIREGKKPAALFELEVTDAGSLLNKLEGAGEFTTVNSVTGGKMGDNTFIFASDSAPNDATIRIMKFLPRATALREHGEVTEMRPWLEFPQTEGRKGRPDGATLVSIDQTGTGKAFETCIAVAAIDSPEIRIIALRDRKQLMRITLPETVTKPTMPTFVTNELTGKTRVFVTTLAPAGVEDGLQGHIFTGKIDSKRAKPIPQAICTYPAWEQIVSRDNRPSASSGFVPGGVAA